LKLAGKLRFLGFLLFEPAFGRKFCRAFFFKLLGKALVSLQHFLFSAFVGNFFDGSSFFGHNKIL